MHRFSIDFHWAYNNAEKGETTIAVFSLFSVKLIDIFFDFGF